VYVYDISSLYSGIDLSSSGVMGANIGTQLSIKAEDGSSFDFISVYFGITHPFEPISGSLQATRNGEVIYSSTNIIPNQEATLYQFNWQSIDEVIVTTSGGTGIFVMDDLEYSLSAVPVPPAIWLFGSGLIGLIGLARRKR